MRNDPQYTKIEQRDKLQIKSKDKRLIKAQAEFKLPNTKSKLIALK